MTNLNGELKVPNIEQTDKIEAILANQTRLERQELEKKKRKRVVKKRKQTLKRTIVTIGMISLLALLVKLGYDIHTLLNPTTEQKLDKISKELQDTLNENNETLQKSLENTTEAINEEFNKEVVAELQEIRRPNVSGTDWQYPVNEFNDVKVVLNSLHSLGISTEAANEIYNKLTAEERQIICAYWLYYQLEQPGEFISKFASNISREYDGEELKEKLKEEYNRIIIDITKQVLLDKTGMIITSEYNSENIIMTENSTVIIDENGNSQIIDNTKNVEQTNGGRSK